MTEGRILRWPTALTEVSRRDRLVILVVLPLYKWSTWAGNFLSGGASAGLLETKRWANQDPLGPHQNSPAHRWSFQLSQAGQASPGQFRQPSTSRTSQRLTTLGPISLSCAGANIRLRSIDTGAPGQCWNAISHTWPPTRAALFRLRPGGGCATDAIARDAGSCAFLRGLAGTWL